MMARTNWMQSFDDEQFEADKEVASASGGEFRDWQTGANVLRILPPVANKGWTRGRLLLPVFRYWNLPPNDKSAADIRRTFGPDHDDPIWNALEALRGQGVDTTKLEAKSRPSFYANVVDMREEEPRVHIQKFTKGLAQWIFAQLADEQLAGRAVLDPYTGTALSVKYDPDSRDPKQVYVPTWHPGQTHKPICQGGDEAVDALMAQCKDLSEVFVLPDDEKMAEMAEIAKELYEYAAPADPVPAQQATGQEKSVGQGQLDDDLPF